MLSVSVVDQRYERASIKERHSDVFGLLPVSSVREPGGVGPGDLAAAKASALCAASSNRHSRLPRRAQLPHVIVEERGREVILWRYALIQNLGDGAGHGTDVVAQVVKRGRLAEDALDPFIESAADEFRRTNAFPFGGLA